jgi:hypothetical protein
MPLPTQAFGAGVDVHALLTGVSGTGGERASLARQKLQREGLLPMEPWVAEGARKRRPRAHSSPLIFEHPYSPCCHLFVSISE